MPVSNHPIAGRVSWSYGSGGRLVLPPSWVSANIGTIYIPQLDGVPTYGGKFSGNVRFYKRAIPQLKEAFATVEAAGLKDKILFWDGSFVPRLKRGGSTPSNHTFGTAFDINAEWNGFRVKPAAKGKKGDLHAVADVFKRFGFLWGGDWQNTPDGMHFEVSGIVVPSHIEKPKTVRFFLHGVRETELVGAEIKDGKLIARVADVADALGYDLVKVTDRRNEPSPRFDVRAVKETK